MKTKLLRKLKKKVCKEIFIRKDMEHSDYYIISHLGDEYTFFHNKGSILNAEEKVKTLRRKYLYILIKRAVRDRMQKEGLKRINSSYF